MVRRTTSMRQRAAIMVERRASVHVSAPASPYNRWFGRELRPSVRPQRRVRGNGSHSTRLLDVSVILDPCGRTVHSSNYMYSSFHLTGHSSCGRAHAWVWERSQQRFLGIISVFLGHGGAEISWNNKTIITQHSDQ